MEREHDYLRAVLQWCLAESDQGQEEHIMPALEVGLRIAGNLHYFWMFHDHHRDELAWLDKALPRGGSTPLHVLARALLTAGNLAGFIHDLTRSQALLVEGVALCDDLGEQGELSTALSLLGWALWASGHEPQRALTAMEEGLRLARQVGEAFPVAFALLHQVIRVASTPAIERGEERARGWTAGTEALHLFRALRDVVFGAMVEEHRGQICGI